MMQLDDVVSSLTTGPRVEEAMVRRVPFPFAPLFARRPLFGCPTDLLPRLSPLHIALQRRSIRWLDRCLAYHKSAPPKPHGNAQTIFAICQGGLDPKLRTICCEEMVKRRNDPGLGGIAIGGLSGGEEKGRFSEEGETR